MKNTLDLNTQQLHIYQFDKPIPGTLTLESLPANAKETVLIQNGLKHIFYCNFEHLAISSTDEAYLAGIELREK